MNYITTHWKTTSAGLAIIITSVVHLIFAVRAGSADETVWTTSLVGVLSGAGLILAGDASASATKADVASLLTSSNTQDKKQS